MVSFVDRPAVSQSFAERWSRSSVEGGWTVVPNGFYAHYAELGIKPTEAMLILHIMARKWDDRRPFPSVARISAEMGIGVSQIRAHLASLERKGFVRRVQRRGRSNEYDFSPLMEQLDERIDAAMQKRLKEVLQPHS